MAIKGTSEFSTPENWEAAQRYAALLGQIPSSFTSSIRTLLLDSQKNGDKLSPSSKFLVTRFVKGPSMRAPFLYAGLTFRPEQLPDPNKASAGELVNLFSPYEIAALLGVLYLYRRARKVCDPEEFEYLSKMLQESVEIGGHLGCTIKNIGLGIGMLSGALPFLASACFLLKDKKSFKEYRRILSKSNAVFDIDVELERWKCANVQVMSILMQSLGFGVQSANSLIMAFSSAEPLDDKQFPEPYKLRIALEWIESLKKTGKEPEVVHKGAYYPLKQDLDRLYSNVAELKKNGPKHNWLEKGKDSISAEVVAPIEVPAINGKIDIDTLPKEVLELFSREELEALSPEEIANLLKEASEIESDS